MPTREEKLHNGNLKNESGNGLSVVIPSFHSEAYLGGLLSALTSELPEEDVEIVVVDSSGDGSARKATEGFAQVRLKEVPQRLYPGAARNIGASVTTRPWLLFIDADCRPEPGWKETLHQLLAEPGPAIAGAIRNGTPHNLVGTLQYYVEFSDFMPLAPHALRPFAPSYLLLVRRDVFSQVGGFPEKLLAAEDLVFGLRLQKTGVVMDFRPEWVVKHLNRTQIRGIYRHFVQLGIWSGRVRRHFPAIRGSWLRWAPLLLPLLPCHRWVKMTRRLLHEPSLGLGRKLLVAALAIPCFAFWGLGFSVGLYQSSPPLE